MGLLPRPIICLSSESMTDVGVSQFSGHSRGGGHSHNDLIIIHTLLYYHGITKPSNVNVVSCTPPPGPCTSHSVPPLWPVC